MSGPETHIPLPARAARGRVMHLVTLIQPRGLLPAAGTRWMLSVVRADGQAITQMRTGGCPMDHVAECMDLGGEGAAVRVVAMPEAA